MQTKNEGRAALAGTLRDPRMIDRLVGAIGTSPSRGQGLPATAARKTGRRLQITVRRHQSRQLTVGRWPRQRQVIVVTIKTLTLGEVAR